MTPTVYELPTGNWTTRAACEGQPSDVFFPEYPANGPRPDPGIVYAQARALCATCPIQTQCLAYSIVLNIEYGMFGGTTPQQRRRLRRNALIRYPCRSCGEWIQHADTGGHRSWCQECRRLRNLEHYDRYRARKHGRPPRQSA